MLDHVPAEDSHRERPATREDQALESLLSFERCDLLHPHHASLAVTPLAQVRLSPDPHCVSSVGSTYRGMLMRRVPYPYRYRDIVRVFRTGVPEESAMRLSAVEFDRYMTRLQEEQLEQAGFLSAHTPLFQKRTSCVTFTDVRRDGLASLRLGLTACRMPVCERRHVEGAPSNLAVRLERLSCLTRGRRRLAHLPPNMRRLT